MGEYLTTREIAKMLGIKTITVRRWIISGKLAAFDIGKEYRVLKRDFEKFMESRKVKQ